MDARPPFYVVWCPESGPPAVRHPHRAAAIAEASRLARQCPGRAFLVLAAVAEARLRDPVEITRFDAPVDDDIPF